MVEGIELLFPHLRGKDYQITSPLDEKYNCIAWAAGDTKNWWWPGDPERTYWPEQAPRTATIEAFRDVFATLGYVACNNEEYEPGIEKVALFAKAGIPKHAARQLPNGRWTSKLGGMEDIEHSLHDLAGDVYGSVV